MKSTFLSPEQVFGSPLHLFEVAGTVAQATDLALLTVNDDGFVTDSGKGINWFLSGGGCVDRFGHNFRCEVCAVRPAILLEEDDRALLKNIKNSGTVTTAEYGQYPAAILDATMRDMAERQYREKTLVKTGRSITVCGEALPVYRLGAKRIVRVRSAGCSTSGFVALSDGSTVGEGEEVFLELRPIRWLYDEAAQLLVCGMALFGGLCREEAEAYLADGFLREIAPETAGSLSEEAPFRFGAHDELSLIRAYVEANIPVFIHGLSGDGKSDRVKEIDPQVLDIELVNETPETINGRAVYNEAKDEIIDIKPAWLIRLERLCQDGKLHILFFDELTNATKQTQSVIFKIVLERFVNNRWALPANARIVAAGNDRSESTASHDLAEPLFGRFAHIYIRTAIDNWMPWAVEHRINPYVLEFLANNELYLRTPYTGTEGNADPRRWEMASRVLDASGNDFSLLAPIVGRDAAETFIRFFLARQELTALGSYTDEELARFSVARKYQLAQQCVQYAAVSPAEAEALVTRLGAEFLAWYRYVLQREADLAE